MPLGRNSMTDRRLIETGIFTIPTAAKLLRIPAPVVRVWVEGHAGKQEPIIRNELGRVDGKVAISFNNLIELQFVAFFVRANVPLKTIRSILEEARSVFKLEHPFSTTAVFQTDGKKIVARIGKGNGIGSIYDLKSKNYELEQIVLPSLKRDVVYDPNGNARIWFPRRKQSPNVIVTPTHSFGRPVLKDSKIPTFAIAKAVEIERSVPMVAAIFEISEHRVREAVKFENSLRMAA
jgi:uncharacterized protein (DUF433 family)